MTDRQKRILMGLVMGIAASLFVHHATRISGFVLTDLINGYEYKSYDSRMKSRASFGEEASIEIIVKNIRDEAVNVRLVEQIHGDWVIRDASEDYIKKDASTIHFPISLKASDSKTVTYTYRKEWK